MPEIKTKERGNSQSDRFGRMASHDPLLMNQGAPTRNRQPGHSASRIAELDGIRGIAILSVLIYHLFSYTMVRRTWTGAAGSILRITDHGARGVDLFFVLSGFLITGILLDARSDPHYFRNFYARRALRILPLYYSVLLVLLCYKT